MITLSDFGVTRFEGQLQGGARVVLFRRPGMPISIHAVFQNGARYDPVGKDGLSHYSEHMLVAGTEQYPTKDLLAMRIEAVGGMFSAATGYERMRLKFDLADAGDVPVAAELMNQMVNRSLLSEKLQATERGSVSQEIDMYDADVTKSVMYRFYQLGWRDPALKRHILGTQETLSAITGVDVRKFFAQMFGQRRLTIVASGGVELPELVAVLDEHLELESDRGQRLVSTPVASQVYSSVVPFDINDQITFRVGFRIPGETSKDAVTLQLLAVLLGGGRASTLMRVLRQERGLVYDVHATMLQLQSEGLWFVHAACAKERLAETLELIATQLRRAVAGGITPAELEFVKNKRLKSLKRGLQTSQEWVVRHLDDEVALTGETIVEKIRRIEAVTLADLQRVAEAYFLPSGAIVVGAGRLTVEDTVLPF